MMRVFRGRIVGLLAWGQAYSTGVPPDQKVNKAEELTYLSRLHSLVFCDSPLDTALDSDTQG